MHQSPAQERAAGLFPFVSELVKKRWRKMLKWAPRIHTAAQGSVPALLCCHIIELKRNKSDFHTDSLLALCLATVESNFASAGGEAVTGAEYPLFVRTADASRGESAVFLAQKAPME